MKIDVVPYPNFKISDNVIVRDIEPVTVTKAEYDLPSDSNNMIMIAKFEGGHRLLRLRPIHADDKVYMSPFPNPIHLFFSLAVEHFENAETVKRINFPTCGKPYGENVFLLDAEENGTHDCFNHFVKYRASSIIMLVSALEAFMNHTIDNSFTYERMNRKGTELERLDKVAIEGTGVSFKEKLTRVIPQYLQRPIFWEDKGDELNVILNLYKHRKSLIHLKTNNETDLDRYFEAMDNMLGFDIGTAINASIKFVNDCSPEFITTS